MNNPTPLLTTSQVATVLGLSEYTVRELLKRRELRGVRICRKWRITQKDLKQFMEKQHA